MFAKRPETEVWLSGKPSCLLEPSSSSSSVTTLLRTTPRLELNEALLVSIRTRVTLIVSEYNRAFDASLNEPRADARTFFIVLFILVFALMELLALHSIKQKTLWDIGSDVLFSSFVAIVAAAYFTAKIYVDEASVPIETGETIRDSPTRMGANAGKRRGARPIDLTPLALSSSSLLLEACQSEMALGSPARLTQATLEIAVINALRAYTIHVASTSEKCT